MFTFLIKQRNTFVCFYVLKKVASQQVYENLKGQYRHDQSRLSTGHGIGVLVNDGHSAAAMVI